ncbi:hypothetical protein FALCPG4_009817 [Fusarium falciforme]
MHSTPWTVIYFANTPMPHGSLSVRMAAIAETMSLSCRADARYTFDALHAAGRPMTSCPRSATSLYTILSQLACSCQRLSEIFEQMELTDPRMEPWNTEKAIQDPIKLDPQAGEARAAGNVINDEDLSAERKKEYAPRRNTARHA